MRVNRLAKKLLCAGIIGISSLAVPVHAAAFFDDFEDGLLQGWLLTNTGSSGTTNVQPHNGSQMAFVQRGGGVNVETSLAHDFSYVPTDLLSFDMQAVATLSTSGNSYSGIKITFLNSLNLSLGIVGFYNSQGQPTIPANGFLVDSNQHSYAAGISDLATLAGLASNAPIAKFTLAFLAHSQGPCSVGCNSTTPTVWFDNVSVSAVPESSQSALILAGLIAMSIGSSKSLRRRYTF